MNEKQKSLIPDVPEEIDVKKVENDNSESNIKRDLLKRKHENESDDTVQNPVKRKYEDKKIEKLDIKNKCLDISSSSSAPADSSSKSVNESDNIFKDVIKDNTVLVAKHYNALEEKGLLQRNQSRIVYMRNFNNWIKSMLINEFMMKVKENSHGSPIRVMDMCCGKGGDLLKWKKADIQHLICTDIAKISVEQCQNRYNELFNRNSNSRHTPVFTAEFITADCTKLCLKSLYKTENMQLDLISCQFAFHYSFESLQQAECMLQNASETLKPGGYFIGTMPDANDLVSRWKKSGYQNFGNSIYNIEFLCEPDKDIPLFGAKYNFHLEGVVNCPEFLVHLPTLCKLAKKYNLELVTFERFEDYYEKKKDGGKHLLNVMQALETYPPNNDTPLVGNTDIDYQHAVTYTRDRENNKKIGTLTLSEWEAISLYAVFAFQKKK